LLDVLVHGRFLGRDEARAHLLTPSATSANAAISDSPGARRTRARARAHRELLGRLHRHDSPDDVAHVRGAPSHRAHEVDTAGMGVLGTSPDAREGITAFLEKRAPNLPGRVSTDMPEFFPWWQGRPFRKL
jgi:enoyl-CoA hydratase/carnithine racemase